jgi:MEMO1 family protein
MPTPNVRPPAVAGRFYPAQAEILASDLDRYFESGPSAKGKIENAFGCVVPHAGYKYSGVVAGAVYRRLPARTSYLILCPNHFGRGEPLAIMSSGSWLTPLGEVPVDGALAEAARKHCEGLKEDAVAHAEEHSLEVQLPFLQRTSKDFTFVPIALGISGYEPLAAIGRGVAKVVENASRKILVIASSDMNHYEADDVTRIKDRKAIDRILALDPEGLYEVIRSEEISMCGYGPTIAMMTAAKELGARHAELVMYATSADASGNRSSVVGYAGIIIS